MEVTGRRKSLGLCILLGLYLTQVSQGAAELVCPEIGYLDSPANLTCIGNGSTHSYRQPSGGVVTTCNLITARCIPDVIVTIPNSSYSVLTLPRVKLSHAGDWSCFIKDTPSHCLMTVAKLPSCIILSKPTAGEVTIRVQGYHCSDSTENWIMETGNLTKSLLNTSLTNTTGSMFETTVHVTTSFEKTKKFVYVCGDKRWEIACKDRAPPIQKVPDKYIVIGVVLPVVFVPVVVVIIIIICKRKNKDQKDQNPDPQRALYYAHTSLEDLKKDNSLTCGVAFVDTGHYEIVCDMSVPETKTWKEVLPLEMGSGGYSTVADIQASETSPQREDTAKPLDTGCDETVEEENAPEPSIRRGDMYATVNKKNVTHLPLA